MVIIMKIGVCAGTCDKWRVVAASDYDYIEGHLGNIMAASDEEYAEMLSIVKESGVLVETTNCFFPKGFVIYAFDPETGDAADFSEVEKNVAEYADSAFKRASALGLKVAVLGSGGNRNIPEGMKPEVADEQFTKVLKICGDAALKYGVKIAIEPLSDCNFVVTLEDAVKFAKAAAHPAVGVLNDFYHSARNGEDITTSLKAAGELIYHMHIACPEGRKMPTIEDKGVILGFCDELKKTGYDARISLEGKTQMTFDEMVRTSYEVMQLVR